MPVSRNKRKIKKNQASIKKKTNDTYVKSYKEFIQRDYNVLVRFSKWVKAGYVNKFSWIKKRALMDAINRQLSIKRMKLLEKTKNK